MMLHVIVDFDRSLHKHYPLMSEYRDLLDSLRRQVDGTQWEVYHHRDDRPFNAYHPLYVETPLLELLRGTETMERQRVALFEAGCEVLAMLQEGGRLGALTDACEAAISKRN